MLNPFSSATSKCPVQQPIENWQLKYVFKTIFSLFVLVGGGEETSEVVAPQVAKFFRRLLEWWGHKLAQPRNPPPPHPYPLHPLHRTTPFLWSHIDSLLISRSSFHRYRWMFTDISPPRSGLAANQRATKKSHRHQVMSLH